MIKKLLEALNDLLDDIMPAPEPERVPVRVRADRGHPQRPDRQRPDPRR